MHDRRVDGKTLILGNQGALFMNAMTWWDHGTGSLWSQPWGSAIDGPLQGTALTLLPASVVPWPAWREQHPDTTVLINDLRPERFPSNTIHDKFVIGVALAEHATAYPYPLASDLRVINDHIGDHPVVVFVEPDSRDIKVYLRRPADDSMQETELLFERDDQGRVVDQQTGSVWDVSRGVATDGPLKGVAIQQIPYVTSFDWAWIDFFPHSNFYGVSREGAGHDPARPPPRRTNP